jgi:putative toxin-antitoxin system antitoxin component (TIGR02293 family)
MKKASLAKEPVKKRSSSNPAKAGPSTNGTPLEAEASMLAEAIAVIGDEAEAMRWMGTPVRALDYATPISLIHTTKGRQDVRVVLSRLEHGVL